MAAQQQLCILGQSPVGGPIDKGVGLRFLGHFIDQLQISPAVKIKPYPGPFPQIQKALLVFGHLAQGEDLHSLAHRQGTGCDLQLVQSRLFHRFLPEGQSGRQKALYLSRLAFIPYRCAHGSQ